MRRPVLQKLGHRLLLVRAAAELQQRIERRRALELQARVVIHMAGRLDAAQIQGGMGRHVGGIDEHRGALVGMHLGVLAERLHVGGGKGAALAPALGQVGLQILDLHVLVQRGNAQAGHDGLLRGLVHGRGLDALAQGLDELVGNVDEGGAGQVALDAVQVGVCGHVVVLSVWVGEWPLPALRPRRPGCCPWRARRRG